VRRHPSRSILRRIQDEPEAVAEQDRAHAASCTRCRRHSEAMAATAATAAAVLSDGQVAVDPAPALRRLRSSETGVVPPKPGALDRLRSRLELGRRRALRTGAILGVVTVTLGTLVATGAAGSLVKIFEPESFVAVPIDINSLGSFPDLSGFGSTRLLQEPNVTTTASLADAQAASGLHLLAHGKLPSAVKGDPSYRVISEAKGSFTFSAATASGTAGKLGKPLPSLPKGLDGSTLTLDAGPAVVETVGSQHGLGQSGGSGAASSGSEAGHGKGLLGSLGGIPQLVIIQMRAPALYSDGPSVAEYEKALLSMPGMPASLADQIRSLGDLSSTLPIPIPTSLASSHAADINGAPGLVIGDTTNIASGVIWQSHGLVYGVAGTLSDKQVVAVARSMH